MRKVIITGLLLMIFMSCTSVRPFKGTADLHGAVYDVKNRPVAGCTILIEGNEKALTDTNGRFVLYGLKSGVYEIETKSLISEAYRGQIEFLNETQYVLITVIDVDTLCESAEKYIDAMNVEKAEEAIYRILAVNGNNSNAVMYLAVLRYKEKNYDAALRVLRDAEKRGVSDKWMKTFNEKLEAEREKNS